MRWERPWLFPVQTAVQPVRRCFFFFLSTIDKAINGISVKGKAAEHETLKELSLHIDAKVRVIPSFLQRSYELAASMSHLYSIYNYIVTLCHCVITLCTLLLEIERTR